MNVLKQNPENVPTNNFKTKLQNATNNQNSKNSNCQRKTTLLLMMTKSMVETDWVEDIGQFLYHLQGVLKK